MLRAVIDANIFYSAFQRDLLWNLVAQRVFQPKWTPEIETEWTRNLLANRPDLSKERLNRTVFLLRQHGWDWQITQKTVTGIIPTLPDPNDQHVLDAAIRAPATFIVTSNTKDFPASVTFAVNVTAITLDAFLIHLMQTKSDDVRMGMLAHVASLKPYGIDAAAYSALLLKNKLVMFHTSVSNVLGDNIFLEL